MNDELLTRLREAIDDHLARVQLVEEGIVTEPDEVREIVRSANEFVASTAEMRNDLYNAIKRAERAFLNGWPAPTSE